MAIKTWTGAGANNNWNTALNWSGGTIPVTADDIVFDGVFPITGNKDCTYNVSISVTSINFTGYTGTFTFSANLTFTGTLTLGLGTTYATSGLPTAFVVATNGTTPGLIANGKILPTNLAINNSGTFTITGNADFIGNLTTTTSLNNLKAATGTTVDLRIGGNISVLAMATNATDHVTIKGYGTSKTFVSGGGLNSNMRVSFASGSTYTSLASSSSVGASFLTVESGGQFNAVSTHSYSGVATISGFNGSSDFFGITGGNTITISTDTIIKSFISINSSVLTIISSGASKILLEGNLTSVGSAISTIDKLEFSGITASNITAATSGGNLQVKEFIINKTGGGSVNFNTAGIFALFVPSTTTYLFTYTNGIVTQNSTCVIRFAGNNLAATTTYSATSPLTFRYIEVFGGTLNLNSQLTATTIKITPTTNPTTITSPSTFGFEVEQLIILNISGGARTVTLKSGVTYTVTANFIANTSNVALNTTLNASTPGTRANFNVEPGGLPSVEYVNATDIDSSGTNGVLPFTKVPIYSLGGTIAATTRNWSTGNQPPPILPSRTVAYTFVS